MAKKINVSVVGGTGYTGIELLRILSQHPLVKINHITSRSDHGKSVADVYPSLRAVIQHKFIDPDKANLADNDLVFFCNTKRYCDEIYRAIIIQQCQSD